MLDPLASVAPMLAKTHPAPDALAQAVGDDRILLQPKIDGHRRIFAADGNGNVVSWNRRGHAAMATPAIAAELSTLTTPLVLDGEMLTSAPGHVAFVAFDLLRIAGADITSAAAIERLEVLKKFLTAWNPRNIIGCPTAYTADEKAAMATRVLTQHGEGLVAKRAGSPYRPQARPNERSWDWTKIKFTKTVDCIVEWIGDTKRNFGVTVMGPDGLPLEGGYATDGARQGGIAEVSQLVGDGASVQVGDVVEVECLYATDPSDKHPHGRLYQPTNPRLRIDKAPDECTVDQLNDIRTDKTLVLSW